MKTLTCPAILLMTLLAACASSPADKPDFAAKNRPLEERCVRQQRSTSSIQPGQTQADVRAQARAAAARGELDKACDAL